jgi:hypothetical protein
MPTATERDEFLAIVCADEELLRAEFEAIVGASWDEPPPPTPREPPTPSWPGPPDPESADLRPATPPPFPCGAGRWARQRSPPVVPAGHPAGTTDRDRGGAP